MHGKRIISENSSSFHFPTANLLLSGGGASAWHSSVGSNDLAMTMNPQIIRASVSLPNVNPTLPTPPSHPPMQSLSANGSASPSTQEQLMMSSSTGIHLPENATMGKFIPSTMYNLPLFLCSHHGCRNFASHASPPLPGQDMSSAIKMCAKHKIDRMVKVYNRCEFSGCSQCALYCTRAVAAYPFAMTGSTERSITQLYCAQHRQFGMAPIYSMCIEEQCESVAIFKKADEATVRYCKAHATAEMEVRVGCVSFQCLT